VLQTLVAEIYGPTVESRTKLGRAVREVFNTTPGVVDVDVYEEDDQPKTTMMVDHEKAALHGISADLIAQTLKIAQDFMRDVDVDSQSAAIASMLIELCRELDLDIVAEGVENQKQLEFLRERGCYVIQGFLFSRPVSAGELGDILRNGAEAQWAAAALTAPGVTAE
jgi:c-di-GMP-related signal transduction protein